MSAPILLVGGSFDPIHHGHLITARAAAEILHVDRVMLIPAADPPHKSGKVIATASDRMAMARLAVDGDELFEVSDIEMRRAGPSYTFDTIMALRAELGENVPLIWTIGGDTLPELASWYRIEELISIVRIVTVARSAVAPKSMDAVRARIGDTATQRLMQDQLDTPRMEISSTAVRRRISAGQSVRYLVPDRICDYIAQNRLYLPA